MYQNPLDALLANKKALVAVGIGGGVLALCSGFFVMALVTVGVLNRNAAGAFAVAPTYATPPPTTAPTQPGKRDPDADAPTNVLNNFVRRLQESQWERAHNMTSSLYQSRVTIEDFRKQMIDRKVKNWKSFDYRSTSSTVQTRNYRCKFVLSNDRSLTFEVELTDEDEGWKVNRLDLES